MTIEPDKGRLELAIDLAERKQTMNDEARRPYDPKPPKASVSLGDFEGHVVGFFGCGGFDEDDNPQFDNAQFVPVETVVIFKKPLTEGTEAVVDGWRCFNARLRHQLVNEPAVIGQLAGKGRAGSPYEVVALPNTDKGNAAYQFVIDEASKNGWVASEASSASRKPVRKDDDDGAF